MNARLITTSPESLQRQADAFSTGCRMFIDTSARYFDLQVDAMKSALEICRGEVPALSAEADLKAAYGRLNKIAVRSIEESTRLFGEGVELASSTAGEWGTQFGAWMGEWRQLATRTQQAQIDFLRSAGAAR